MTTSSSPAHKIKAQADRMAAHLKAAEQGERPELAAARARETVSFAVAMDDKILKIEMPWVLIAEYSAEALSTYIAELMRGGPTVQ